ncbi:SCA7, zinc-binding domain-containing protein [Phycomyces blakesleeanus]|uniref:SCA7, zinc-binding domain-containing protein n=1 Tax=Phycomyces blakesleeanus TaxID=4837 RepID=A0ABR3BDY3_PHYBL
MSNTKLNAKRIDVFSEEQQDILKQKGSEIEQLQTNINLLSDPLSANAPVGWAHHISANTLSLFQGDSHWNTLSLDNNSQLLNNKNNSLNYNGSQWDKMTSVVNPDYKDMFDTDQQLGSASLLDSKDRRMFGVMPMKEEIVMVKCTHCERPILGSSFNEHADSCCARTNIPFAGPPTPIPSHYGNPKGFVANELFSDDEDSDGSVRNRKHRNEVKKHESGRRNDSIGSLEEPETSQFKRALSPNQASEKAKKKTKKEKQKNKVISKPKGPLDLDRQCGVLQGPNSTPCTRSLTCKSHSMGAKRAVEGRSQPYNELLAAYQKKGVGRPQVGPTGLIQTERPLSTSGIGYMKPRISQIDNSGIPPDVAVNDKQSIDSDEEVECVLRAIQNHCNFPLAQKPVNLYKRKQRAFRVGNILRVAITPKSSGIMGFSDAIDTTMLSHSM